MNTELLLDSINIIAEKSQNSIEQIIRKAKPINEKLKFVTLYLQEMKSQIFQWICNLLNANLNIKEVTKRLHELKINTDQGLAKNRLHILLKKKLEKLKKQSFMHSVDSHDNFFNQESRILELEKSLIQIEKDLNIQPEQQDSLAISSIIQKSRMFNFNQSAVKDQHNVSLVSQTQIFSSAYRENTIIQSSKYYGSVSHFNLAESNGRERQQKEEVRKMKQNEQRNVLRPIQAQVSQKKQADCSKDKISEGPKPVKKMKKKTQYLTMSQSGNISKQTMLGNLLEECLENEKK